MLTLENGSSEGQETLVGVAPVNPDIYNWEKRYASARRRLEGDQGAPDENRAKIREFLESREVKGPSPPRVVKYANHLIVIAMLCTKNFEAMTAEDVRELLVKLKNREKESGCWTRTKGERYSDHTLSDIKFMLKVFWRWIKGMDEFKPIYPSEVSWFAEGRFKSITVTRSDLLREEEVDLLANATGDAQDAACAKVLHDAGGRISERLILRIRDVEPRPCGFKLNVWVSKTYAHPMPIAKSPPALARRLSLHPFRENPDAPLWLNYHHRQLLYSAARRRIHCKAQSAEKTSGRNLGKKVWFHLFCLSNP